MAKIVHISGNAADPLNTKDPVQFLRALADKIERGDIPGKVEEWMFIIQYTPPDKLGSVLTRCYDSELTLATANWFLDCAKRDLMDICKGL